LTSVAFRKTQYEEKDGELAVAIVIFKGSEKNGFSDSCAAMQLIPCVCMQRALSLAGKRTPIGMPEMIPLRFLLFSAGEDPK
jgi:hypothetical protein